MSHLEEIKKNVGRYAAELIQPGMRVGLGTGSTAHYFIEALIKRCKEGLKIEAVATSKASEELAIQGGIPLLDIEAVSHLDITVDGADEIDEEKRMIKGAGGALLKEKILASMSHEMVVIIDESKLVKQLGKRPLPVEISPFGKRATENHLIKLGFSGSWRKNSQGSLYTTDSRNYIFDVIFKELKDPELIHEKIKRIPGVIETGFFFHLAGRVVVGFQDGQIIIRD